MNNDFTMNDDKSGFTLKVDFEHFEVRVENEDDYECFDHGTYAEALACAEKAAGSGEWDRVELCGCQYRVEDYECVDLGTWNDCPRNGAPAEKMKFFVYGTLKRGGRYNRALSESSAQFLGTAQTVTTEFSLLDLGPYPAAISAQLIGEVGTVIQGELFEATKRTKRTLDGIEGYPNLYDRKEITVLADGVEHTAWMYFMRDAKYLGNFDYSVCLSGNWPILQPVATATAAR